MCLPTSLYRSSLSKENPIAIFTESGISAGATQGEAASIIPGQLAVTEAARVVSELIREDRDNFIVAGGASLLFRRACVSANETDEGITANRSMHYRKQPGG